MIYTASELRKMPTLTVGQCCNLKIDRSDIGLRVWLCRVGGGVSIERLRDGRWKLVSGGCMRKTASHTVE